MDLSQTDQIDAATVKLWLDWAGAKLISMPGQRSGPRAPHVIWPEYSRTAGEVTTFRNIPQLRANPPTGAEYQIIDLILDLPNVCDRLLVRRIVRCRSLTHPIRGNPLYNWTRISELLAVKTYTVKRLYNDGLAEIARKAKHDDVCRIAAFFAQLNDFA